MTSETSYEYGFYDSYDTDDVSPPKIWDRCFGLPFTTPEAARHAGEKTVWGDVVIVRRRSPADPWEGVPNDK